MFWVPGTAAMTRCPSYVTFCYQGEGDSTKLFEPFKTLGWYGAAALVFGRSEWQGDVRNG